MSTVTCTPSACCATPTTLLFQRSSMPGWALASSCR
ncbi:Uncharacterised protein [Bordetella pertussis]|nr:Uncharacterised protein [Bordetella pertussis]